MLDDWPDWLPQIHDAADRVGSGIAGTKPIPESSISWLLPVGKPRKMICIGTNYGGHAAEVSAERLKMPYSFLKSASNTLRGSGQDVVLPSGAAKNDLEVELAVVIGRAARDVTEADALGHVAGYTVMNEVSVLDWVGSSPKFLGIGWVMGKTADSYAPMGPYFTPAEFVPNPQNLRLELTLNGKTMQNGNTSDMIFGIAQVIAHLSRIMTLEPGDIIATGTPEGVGFGRKPPIFLKDGAVVRCAVEGLGTLENRFVR
jgi:2-keto-4-pentenoate hydratase/2-oxohepta-3-ene-1,7-dioic acid hydratase in catechol pathway